MQLSKIQHIIKFIEDNSTKQINTKELELISCSSYRNLQRIFKKIFNETIGAFQQRLKLENAYRKLIYTANPISDIAIDVGFESVHSFSKSFKNKFGVSPTHARIHKQKLFGSLFNSPKSNYKSISCELVFIKEKTIFYKAIKTNNYSNNEIELLWDSVDSIINVSADLNYYGIIVDEPLITDKAKCRYEACVDKNPLSKTFFTKKIFGGKYAKFIHYGNYNKIETTYKYIYNDWLFKSELQFDNSPIIEYYIKSNFNEIDENKFVTEILIPIIK